MADQPDSRASTQPHGSSTDSPEPAPRAPDSGFVDTGAVKDQIKQLAGGDGAPLDPAAEAPLWTGRTHWKHFVGTLSLWVAALLVLGYVLYWMASGEEGAWMSGRGAVQTWLLVAIFSGLIVLGRVLITIISCRYRLTTQRIFIEEGLFSQTIDHTELIRVDDVQIRKTFLNRLLGVGSVVVYSTDASHKELTIEGVEKPEIVAEHIRTRMRTMRRKSLFVENL